MIAATLTHADLSPYISEQAVKIALNALLYSLHAPNGSSLESLLLVDEILMDAAFPLSAYRRDYALAHLLSSVIAEKLNTLRRVFGLHLTEPGDSLEAAKQAIEQDKQSLSPELLGWSWLYHHYVRVDLMMRRDLFCQMASIELRTLLRYQQQAIRRLTACLMEREWHIRRERHRRRLYTRLPSMTSASFCGREDALKQVRELYDRLQIHYFQVFGEAGIGKTAFVQQAVRSLIDSDSIDELIWLGAPVSSRHLQQHLQQMLTELEIHISLREYTQRYRVAFVLDGLDLWEDNEALGTVLDDLGAAIVFLTSRNPLPLRGAMGYIALSELSVDDATHLISRLLNAWHMPCFEPTSLDVQYLWEQVGGNPRLIMQAVFEFQSQHSQMSRNYAQKATSKQVHP